MSNNLSETVRLPVIRKDGSIELLPYGLDAETGVITLPSSFEEGAEVDAHGIEGQELLGETGEEVDSQLASPLIGKGLLHSPLPSRIVEHATHLDHAGFPDYQGAGLDGVVQDLQREGDELGVGPHAGNSASSPPIFNVKQCSLTEVLERRMRKLGEHYRRNERNGVPLEPLKRRARSLTQAWREVRAMEEGRAA